MKKWLFIALFAVFAGCAKTETAWETVQDEAFEQVSVSGNDLCRILVFTPEDAREVAQGGNSGRVFSNAGGEYKIKTRHFFADSTESAIRQVTGRNQNEITVLEANRFGLPEYRFAWNEAGESGSYDCRAELVRDGNIWYSVETAVREGLENDYEDLSLQVFSSFGLYQDQEI